ncbi:MAG: DUF4919 domain-containing protein [Rikenellaceae bacterium]|nr:DUF4919 domain-containing protein [Rikenellaceae bacterium]
MKQWLPALLIFWPLWTMAQAPDNDKIDLAIHQSSSPYYYPNLMERYRRADESLTTEDYRHLYYGYMFDPGYNPYASIPEMDSVLILIMRDPDLSSEDYKRLIHYGSKVLESDPFNPRMLNVMTYAYHRIGDTENALKSARRFNGVINAILSSGEGNKEQSPWHILYFSHAEDVMDQFGMQYHRPVVVSRTTEFFRLLKRAGNTRGYYFDYSRVYIRRPEELPQPQERRWQINDRVL